MRIIKIILISIVIVILIIVLGYIFIPKIYNLWLSPKKQLSNEEIKTNVTKIFENTTRFVVYCNVDDYSQRKLYDAQDYYSKYIENMNTDEFVLSASNSGTLLKREFEPKEITAAFKCFLYLKGKELPKKLIGISTHFDTGGFGNTGVTSAFIPITDFEEIYSKNKSELAKLSINKAAKKVAEIWIKKTGYVKE